MLLWEFASNVNPTSISCWDNANLLLKPYWISAKSPILMEQQHLIRSSASNANKEQCLSTIIISFCASKTKKLKKLQEYLRPTPTVCSTMNNQKESLSALNAQKILYCKMMVVAVPLRMPAIIKPTIFIINS